MNQFSFKKYQPLALRIWHWLNALAILGLLLTVLLRKTVLSWRTNSSLIQDKLKATWVEISPDLAKEIAVAIRNPLWDVHIYLGYLLAGLLILRLFVFIFVEKKFDFLSHFKSVINFKSIPSDLRTQGLHYHMVKIGYFLFYGMTFFMVVTGLILTFKNDTGLTKDLLGQIKEIHELSMWFFVVFVAGHLIGVIKTEFTKDKGIVSDMIHGGDKSK